MAESQKIQTTVCRKLISLTIDGSFCLNRLRAFSFLKRTHSAPPKKVIHGIDRIGEVR